MIKNDKLVQGSRTGKFEPGVRLISMTQYPTATLFNVWNGSRRATTYSTEEIDRILFGRYEELDEIIDVKRHSVIESEIVKDWSDDPNEKAADVITRVALQSVESNLPSAEAVNFVFEINNASVAWREQLVRSKFASYWMQSSRVFDMRTMNINMSDSIERFGGEEAVKIYEDTAETIRNAYKMLVDLGVPQEDIRLQPQQHTHRVYWMVSLRSLIGVLNKRSSWIAQATLWTPIVSQICKILRDNGLGWVVDHTIGKLPQVQVSLNSGLRTVTRYEWIADNKDRFDGKDPAPCDPLWLAYSDNTLPEHTDIELYDYMKSIFINIWSDEYLEVLCWDRSDPNKIGPYDRPVSTNYEGEVNNDPESSKRSGRS